MYVPLWLVNLVVFTLGLAMATALSLAWYRSRLGVEAWPAYLHLACFLAVLFILLIRWWQELWRRY